MAIAKGLMEVILYVQDMGAQVAFYRDVLELQVLVPQGVRDFSEVYWVEFETGACKLALHAGGQRSQSETAPKIVFRVGDVPSVRNVLLRRGVSMGDIRSPAPGVQVSDGIDPEGNRFSIESRQGVAESRQGVAESR
jgi:predicted enzyme related to lactoylglutathione lyase